MKLEAMLIYLKEYYKNFLKIDFNLLYKNNNNNNNNKATTTTTNKKQTNPTFVHRNLLRLMAGVAQATK